jgi:hypothetical protein
VESTSFEVWDIFLKTVGGTEGAGTFSEDTFHLHLPNKEQGEIHQG